MSAHIPVIKFCFKGEWKPLEQALAMSQAYESLQHDDAQATLAAVEEQAAALIICALADKQDLVQIATLVKLAKKSNCVLKLVVVNFAKTKQFDLAVNKLGIQEVLDVTVPPKSLRFKLDLWLKALKSQTKYAGAELSVKSAEAKTQKESKTEDKNLQHLPALNCQDDIWLQHRDYECKKVLGRWLMRLMGPSPYVAQWAEVQGKNNLWRLDFTQNKAQFVKGNGDWYFRGDNKPEFNWKENLWYMNGDNADLFYYETEVISRLQLKDKVLSLSANSTFAKAKEKLILESFDKDLVFKTEAASENLDSFAEKGDSLDTMMKGLGQAAEKEAGHLQGKGKTDHQKQGNLQGENKGEADLGGQLSGKSSTSKLDHSGMGGPAGDSLSDSPTLGYNNKHHTHETKYKGHFEPDLFEALDEEQKEKKEKEAQKASGPLAGKANTSHIDMSGLKSPSASNVESGSQLEQEMRQRAHETKYKGHFEPEQHEALEKEKAKREKLEREQHGPMSGKGSTSELDHRGQQGPGAGAMKEGSLLDLENKNHSHETKYKGHHQAEQFEAKEARKNQYQQDDQDGEYGGRSQTDHLKKHYGGSHPVDQREEETESQNPRFAQKGRGKASKAYDDGDVESEDENSNLIDLNAKSQKRKLSKQKQSGKEKAIAFTLNTIDPSLEEASQNAQVEAYLVHEKARLACELDDFFEDQVIFRLAKCHLKDQDKVDLDISFNYLKNSTQLKVSGVVVSNDVSEETAFVTVTIAQKGVEEFEAFMKLYQKRQQNVEFFLKKVKGL